MGIYSSDPVSVQIIRRTANRVLVEWQGENGIPQRSWVDSRELVQESGRSAQVREPNRGIPYGVEFRRIVEMRASSADLERELKARGIWTGDDVRARPNDVVSALMAAYGVDVATVLRAVDQFEKQLKQA